jgi:hypothetical protein
MLDWMLSKRPVVLNNSNTTAGKRLKTTVKITFQHKIPMPHFPVRNDVNVCLQITTPQHCASCYIIQLKYILSWPIHKMICLFCKQIIKPENWWKPAVDKTWYFITDNRVLKETGYLHHQTTSLISQLTFLNKHSPFSVPNNHLSAVY